MDNQHPLKKLQEKLQATQLAGEKVAAAEMMVEAATTELKAALTLGDWDAADKAREQCVARYEAFLDLQISSVRSLRDME